MVIDLEAVRISGSTDTFNTVDKIKNSLESSECFNSATISSAKLDRTGNKVEFEIKLERAG
jgi:YbbR domain-containing protein